MYYLTCMIVVSLVCRFSDGNSLGSDNNILRSKDKTMHYKQMMDKLSKAAEHEEEVPSTIKISSQIEIPDSEGLRLVMEAMRVIWSAILKGMFDGFFPVIERVRRDTSSEWRKNFLLDWILDTIGALIGRQRCSQKIACRTGKVMQEKLPGVQLVLVMLESFVPPAILEWYGIVRQSVMDRSDSCSTEYICDFSSTL